MVLERIADCSWHRQLFFRPTEGLKNCMNQGREVSLLELTDLLSNPRSFGCISLIFTLPITVPDSSFALNHYYYGLNTNTNVAVIKIMAFRARLPGLKLVFNLTELTALGHSSWASVSSSVNGNKDSMYLF